MWPNKRRGSALAAALLLLAGLSASAAPRAAEENLKWLRVPVQRVEFLKKMMMAGVEDMFVRTDTEEIIPPIQHFQRKMKTNFEVDFKRITREILAATSEGGHLPPYVKTVDQEKNTVEVKGRKYNSLYLEYEYKSEKMPATYMTCFAALESQGLIHVFFSSSYADSFPTCKKQMQEVFKEI
jgi:hypothetical protein